MSLEEFYLDQGFIKIKGSQSAAERLLRKKLENHGVDEETVDEYMQSVSENEKREKLKSLISEENKENEQKRNKVEEKFYNIILKGKVEKDAAWFYSKLFGQFYQKYGAKNQKVFDNRFDKLDVKYNVPVEKATNLFQSGYHGSPYKFDEFSNDAVGTGEGAQVHGYGTYVAESKDIADERYRKRLVGNKNAIEVGSDVYYLNDDGSWSSQDGQEYWDSDTYYGYVLEVFNRTEDKEKSIKWLQDDLNEVLADKQEFVEENGLDGKLLEINSDNGFVNEGGYEYFDTVDEYLQRELMKYDDRISTYMRAIEVLKKNDIRMYQGQLYEVEIPEDEEMLDEDLPFSEQPENVQNAFGEMIKADKNGQLIFLDSDKSETPMTSLSIGEIVGENPNGKKIYDRISSAIADVYGVDYAEADKLASKLLNGYGIKGIKYDGQIDGKSYVIFNPENIDITKTFYQKARENQTFDNSISRYSKSEDLVADYSSTFEDIPDDYKINVLNDALKDLEIDKDHPKKIETPEGKVLVTAKTIEHIIDREDDKTRYKSINKMFATLKNPTFVNISENGGMYYFKIFKTSNGTKNQTVVVKTNELGEVVETTYPTKRDNKFRKRFQPLEHGLSKRSRKIYRGIFLSRSYEQTERFVRQIERRQFDRGRTIFVFTNSCPRRCVRSFRKSRKLFANASVRHNAQRLLRNERSKTSVRFSRNRQKITKKLS